MMLIRKEEQEDAIEIIKGFIEDKLLDAQDWSYNDDSFDHEFGTEKAIWIGYDGEDEITVDFISGFNPESDPELMAFIESPTEFYYDGEDFDAYFYLSLLNFRVGSTGCDGAWRVILTYAVDAEAE